MPPPPTPPSSEVTRLRSLLSAERAGRASAERALRAALNGRLYGSESGGGLAGGCSVCPPASACVCPGSLRHGLGYACHPVGFVRSPFRGRWGAPRQGLLAPEVRAEVRLVRSLPAEVLEGLAAYSHVYLVWIFHDNTMSVPGSGPPPRTFAGGRGGAGWGRRGRAAGRGAEGEGHTEGTAEEGEEGAAQAEGVAQQAEEAAPWAEEEGPSEAAGGGSRGGSADVPPADAGDDGAAAAGVAAMQLGAGGAAATQGHAGSGHAGSGDAGSPALEAPAPDAAALAATAAHLAGTPWAAPGRGFSARVAAPGLFGARTGVFATRSPHRPNALGLSLVRLLEVDV